MKIILAILRTTLGVVGPDTVDTLARGLKGEGIEIILLTAKTAAQPAYKKIHYCPFKWSYAKLPLCLIYFIRNVRKISRDADIVQLYLPSPAFAFIADLVSWKNKTPVVTVFESSLTAEWPAVKRLIKKSPSFYLSRILINNFLLAKLTNFNGSAYVVSSYYQKLQLQSIGYPERKISVIPNLIDTDKYDKLNTIETKEKFNLAKEFVITYIGHLTHNKGVDLLIKAFASTVTEMPSTRLVIAWSKLASGQKRIKKIIKGKKIENKIVWLGEVDVPALLSATDILVLPYRVTFATQLFPSTLLEALSVGVPLITTKLKPLDEIVKDKETAWLVSPDNYQEIVAAVRELFQNEELRKEMIFNQRQLARQKFSQAVVVNQYLKLYKELKNG